MMGGLALRLHPALKANIVATAGISFGIVAATTAKFVLLTMEWVESPAPIYL